MSIIRKIWLDCILVVGLAVTPVFRDIVGGILSGNNLSAILNSLPAIHIGIESAFMAVVGIGLSWFRHRQRWALNTNRQLAVRVARRTEEIRITQHTAIEALAALCEYNDTDTGDHIRRIREYVRLLGQWMQSHSRYSAYLSRRPDYVAELATASMLHDIGKTAIPGGILSKQGPLTDDEYEIMKTHTTVAGELFLKANQEFIEKTGRDSYLALARDIAFYHHERWDGGGYPKGLAGEKIPLCARIVAVADVYDALTSRRPYKAPWTHEDAMAEIVRGGGSQFDPSVVDAFKSQHHRFEAIAIAMRPEAEDGRQSAPLPASAVAALAVPTVTPQASEPPSSQSPPAAASRQAITVPTE
jgi:HD-GYP domain-containing protein (c-di-GMP phosphodiesterase class II)